MLDSFLPTGCCLRPARTTDKAALRHLLTQLERELTTPERSWVLRGTVLTGVGLLIAWATIVPGGRTVLQPFLLPTMGVLIAASLLLPLLLQREWAHYWVIEADGVLVACAKLQRHGSYSVLFDVYVLPEWRQRGVGSHLVRHLGQQATKPLYLACLPARLPFYTRLGFSPIASKTLSPVLQYDLGLMTRSGIIPLVLV